MKPLIADRGSMPVSTTIEYPKSEFARLREQAGWTIEDAAKHLGCPSQTVTRYESGAKKPEPLVYRAMRQAAGERLVYNAASQPFRFIDLFAGIGGLRLGFEAIGSQCVFTSE